MLIYDALKKDHEVLKNLLQQMEDTSEGAVNRRRDLLQRLYDELVPHARAEEKVLYDTLKEIEGTEDIALEGYEEHSTVESLLRELQNMDPSDARWAAKLTVLKENLQHHLREEEDEMFSLARQVLAHEEAEMMTEAFQNLKKKVENGSIMQNALETVAQFMPARFAQRFSDVSKRLTT